jgi:hypothetical protein
LRAAVNGLNEIAMEDLRTLCEDIDNEDSKLWLITAYLPTLDKWESDYKTRKAAE